MEHMGYHAVSKQEAVPDILVRDLGVTQVQLHNALLSHALCVQLEARSLLETRRNLSDQLPLRVRQPHHLQRERDRGRLWQRLFTMLVTQDSQFAPSQKQNHMRDCLACHTNCPGDTYSFPRLYSNAFQDCPQVQRTNAQNLRGEKG